MEVFGNFLNWANRFIFGEDQDSALPVPTEQTVAPHNIHTIQFDVTQKPIEALPDLVPIVDTADPDLTPILDELLNSFMGNTDDYEPTSYTNPDVDVSKNINSTIIAEDNGNSIVKVVEDATGKTVELWHEVVAETTTTANKILNTTTSTTSNSTSEVNYVNDYIIAALVLILVVITCLGVLFWCRSNRLKTEKRNKYPVMTVVNNEYMNPQMLKNNDKLKNIP